MTGFWRRLFLTIASVEPGSFNSYLSVSYLFDIHEAYQSDSLRQCNHVLFAGVSSGWGTAMAGLLWLNTEKRKVSFPKTQQRITMY